MIKHPTNDFLAPYFAYQSTQSEDISALTNTILINS